MSNLDNEKLIQDCTLLKQVIQDSLTWVSANVEKDKQAVTNYNLKKFRRDANRFEKAVPMRPSIAIFGQSQVGKSYLVSNLAKTNEDASLFVKNPGTSEEIDFIAKINPPGGGKEATGVVSRFTAIDSHKPGWQPYAIRLFSQADIVKIISNGYLSDITHYTYSINRDEIQKKIKTLELRKVNSPVPGLTEDEIYEIKEYLNHKFRDNFLLRELNMINFWEDISTLVPYIDPLSRWELFEFIWGKQPFFTDIFKRLSEGLKQVNFLSEVRCELAALTPQLDTILDVERLRELYKSTSKPEVKLYDGGTFLASLNRSVISALTAEVVLPLLDKTANHPSRAFLQQADVLDFPGARSRQQIPEITFADKSNDDKLLVFLRGKVAFLFDRYNFNYEISTLLFCMDDKQPEVADLPKFLYEWIKNTHGDSPQKREERERKLEVLVPQKQIEDLIPLLVVFTKFNIELAGNPATELPGQLGPHNAKWKARIGANFADQMGISVGDQWIKNWNSNGTFKNLFPLRDPKWSRVIYDGMDNAGRETSIKPEYVQKLKDMEDSWLNHEDVVKHFHNPQEVWKECTDLNKSGIDYVIKYLTPTCNPIIKREQIKSQIQELKTRIHDELSAYYQGGNVEEKLKKAKLNATNAFMALMKMQKENNTFGNFVDRLVITDDLSWKIYFDLMMNKQIDVDKNKPKDEMTAQVEKTVSMDLIEMLNQFITIDKGEASDSILNKLKEYFGIDDNKTLKEILDENGIDIQSLIEQKNDTTKPVEIIDRSTMFASNLLSRWLEYIEEIKNDDVLDHLGLKRKIADLILHEINKNKNRVNLKKIIADQVREHVETFQLTSNVDIVARIAANILNKFVNTLGWCYLPQKDRPKVRKEDALEVFAEVPVSSPSKKDLKLGIQFPGEKYFVEWSAGLRSSFEANVYFEANVKDSERAEADAKLGALLQKVKQ